LMMLRAIYREDNIVFRTKLTKARIKVVTPKIARVISRGIKEGLFFTGNPIDVADMILSLAVYMGDEIAKLILDGDLSSENKKRYLEKCQTYNEVVQRILGAPKGSITICKKEIIESFFNE
ncbi:hypothetical protein JW935_24675, partial [candidate division KSB1 bacterium]|nr:hypothetical protein [candidate division KSB1 bacterium]